MNVYKSTRRAFLAVVSGIAAVAIVPLRRWLSAGNALIGEWSVVEYVCDGKPALRTARKVSVAITSDTLTVRLQMAAMPEYTESSRYTVHPSAFEIDIGNKDDSATFEGVYAFNGDRLTLVWDTIGKGRPRNIMEADRFGLNRMVVTRA